MMNSKAHPAIIKFLKVRPAISISILVSFVSISYTFVQLLFGHLSITSPNSSTRKVLFLIINSKCVSNRNTIKEKLPFVSGIESAFKTFYKYG